MEQTAIAVIIPSYEPSENLPSLVANLRRCVPNPIIVVNDGSNQEKYHSYFDQCASLAGVSVLHHEKNLGKGRALKTAFFHCLAQNIPGAVTVDGDGQHLPEDIGRCIAALAENPDALVLGSRSFQRKKIPFKNKLGNLLTCHVFRLLIGKNLSDTQTGLRGISAAFMEKLLTVPGERFEFEMKMLLVASSLNMQFKEVGIATVYKQNNVTHFKPIRDSWLIYITLFGKSIFQLFSFFFSGIITFLIDISLFSIMYRRVYHNIDQMFFCLSLRLFLSVVFARCVAVVINYFLNRNFVFRHKGLFDKRSMIRFFSICGVMALVSYGLTEFALVLFKNCNPVLLKACADMSLVCITFLLQKFFVFRTAKPRK